MIDLKKSQKLNLVLDLDATLICSVEPHKVNKEKKKYSKLESANMDDYYVVFERPYLDQFLDYIFKHYNVSIWTAASKDYAIFIIDKILLKNKTDRKLDWIFTSYHTKISEKKVDHSKSLKLLKELYKLDDYTLDNTIILDDNEEVFSKQKKNCIPAKPFDYKTKYPYKDTFLIDLIKEGGPLNIDNESGCFKNLTQIKLQ